jgi:hypothetical protein
MCGGMHHVSLAPMVAAVSNTGAMGFLTAVTQPTPELLRQEIRKTRMLTSKPFGVNVSFLPAATPPDYEAYIKVILEEGIKVVETAGNNPGKYIKMFKDGGCIVIHKCVTIRHARTALKFGADIISMDGFGKLTNMCEIGNHSFANISFSFIYRMCWSSRFSELTLQISEILRLTNHATPQQDDVGGLVLFALACRELGAPFIASGGIVGLEQQLTHLLLELTFGENTGNWYPTRGLLSTWSRWDKHGDSIHGNSGGAYPYQY